MLKKLKITTWNINGLKALPLPIKLELDQLDSDIICFQETKCNENSLSYENAVVKGYQSYFSFCQTRPGYSGVCIYCKDYLKPIRAEPGLIGLIKSLHPFLKTDIAIREMLKITVDELQSLEAEGRSIFCEFNLKDCDCGNTDKNHSIFIINVYCPMAESDNVERLKYKTMFNNLLKLTVDAILLCKSHVVLVGDLNIKHKSIDIAESIPEDIFVDNFHRHWFDCLLIDSQRCEKLAEHRPSSLVIYGKLVDTFRLLNPTSVDQYTCWNTMTGARLTNFGSRIDYILCDACLLSNFDNKISEVSILSNIPGSDHCPVTTTFERVYLLSADHNPPLCSSSLPQFRRQTRITSFFKRDENTFYKSLEDAQFASLPPPTKKQKTSVDIIASSNQSNVNDQWKMLLKGPSKPPRCSIHNIPCVQRTVVKDGPNKGRQFWTCSNPNGLSDNPLSRCNFFLWSAK